MRARLPARYLGWMARDAALGPGLVALIIVGLMSFIVSRTGMGPPGQAIPPERLLLQTVGGFDWLMVLVTTSGIVSGDLAKGYYRAVFSRPVSPALYYLQRWLVGGVLIGSFFFLAGLGVGGKHD